MTTATTSYVPAFRFKFVDDQTDIIYVGEAEKDPSTGDITILSAWEIGMTVEEIFPYAKGFSLRLRRQLEQAALECRMSPPAGGVELPTDWDGIVVVDSETVVTVEAKYVLPDIGTDQEASIHGLSTVRRIKQTAPNRYVVTAKGPLSNIPGELYRARLF